MSLKSAFNVILKLYTRCQIYHNKIKKPSLDIAINLGEQSNLSIN
jgi:hypothetical protein